MIRVIIPDTASKNHRTGYGVVLFTSIASSFGHDLAGFTLDDLKRWRASHPESYEKVKRSYQLETVSEYKESYKDKSDKVLVSGKQAAAELGVVGSWTSDVLHTTTRTSEVFNKGREHVEMGPGVDCRLAFFHSPYIPFEQVYDAFYNSRATEYTMGAARVKIEHLKGELQQRLDYLLGYESLLDKKPDTETIYCRTINDVRSLVEEIRQVGEFTFDFESIPKERGLSKRKQLEHATHFLKSDATMLSISTYPGSSYLIPLYHYESWFNISRDYKLSFETSTVEQEDGVDSLEITAIVERGDGTREPLTRYDESIVSFDPRCFKQYKKNEKYCRKNGISDMVKEVCRLLAPVFEDRSIRKIAYNAKFDYKIAGVLGLRCQGVLDDPMMMVHTLNELWFKSSIPLPGAGGYKSLKQILPVFFPEFRGWEEDIDYSNDSFFKLAEYAAIDTDGTTKLDKCLMKLLWDNPELYNVYRSLERSKIYWLAGLEERGTRVNTELIEETMEEAEAMLQELLEELRSDPVCRAYVLCRAEEDKARLLKEAMDKIKELESAKIEKIDQDISKLSASWVALSLEYKNKCLETDLPVDSEKDKKKDKKRRKVLASLKRRLDGIDNSLGILRAKKKKIEEKAYAHKDYPYKTVVNKAKQITDIAAGRSKLIFSDINFNSPKQVVDLLYEHPEGFQIPKPYISISKQVKGVKVFEEGYLPTTDKKFLRDMGIPFVDKYLLYKELGGLVKNSLNPIKTNSVGGRIYSSYKTVKTQRLGSSNINLQNLRSRTRQETLAKLTARVKTLMIPDNPVTQEFFELDYGQMELRVMGETAKDPEFIKVYQAYKDIHALTAMRDAGITEAEYNLMSKSSKKELRQNGKASNFSCIYKVSAKGFQRMAQVMYGLKLTLKEAERRVRNWMSLYKKIPDFHDLCCELAAEHGYVKTVFGSRRYTPFINSPNIVVANREKRIACNTGTQGSGSQFLLFSGAVFDQRNFIMGYPISVQVTVHDSVGGWVGKETKREVLTLMSRTFNKPPTKEYFNWEFEHIPMVTDVEIGPSWGQAEEIKSLDDL